MTSGTWDVYWVAVLKRFQRRHIGSLLLSEVEKEIGFKEGRLIVIETSSKRGYYSTRRFYQKMGYHITARIVRFYSERDDKLIFCKYFTH
jgi:ribosomal protein S18 acetylase RimI-like enzyme